MPQVDSFARRQVHTIQILVLLDAKCILDIVVVIVDFLIIQIELLQNYLLQQFLLVVLYFCERLAERRVLVLRLDCPDVDFVLT